MMISNITTVQEAAVIVCVCHAVRCREIDQALDEGARTVREVGARCSAGTDCGVCAHDIRARIAARGVAVECDGSGQGVEERLAAK